MVMLWYIDESVTLDKLVFEKVMSGADHKACRNNLPFHTPAFCAQLFKHLLSLLSLFHLNIKQVEYIQP